MMVVVVVVEEVKVKVVVEEVKVKVMECNAMDEEDSKAERQTQARRMMMLGESKDWR
jgi:hypothetical protein